MILVYSKQTTERLSYTLDLIFNTILKIGFRLTNDKLLFQKSELPKINYSEEDIDNSLKLQPHSILFETEIVPQKIESFTFENHWCFFPSSANSFLPFDVFACSFFIASRYEEYLFKGETAHGRFPAKESFQYKNRILDQPVVNQWSRLLAGKITEKYPEILVPAPEFRFLMTIDVDNAWAYKNKTFYIQAGGLLRSFCKADFAEIKKRVQVLRGKETDPFETYQQIESALNKDCNHLKFFFLLGNRSKYDRNISHNNIHFQQLIQHLSEKYEVGIHPSYQSNDYPELLKNEVKRLETITGQKTINSRQHFLKMKLPETYEHLISAGIKNDFTMGYADAVGFRAGLSCPFHFFNLEKNNVSKLIVFPLNVMDVTLKNYLKLLPDEAIATTRHLMETVKTNGGTFTALWHNESVGDCKIWQGWQNVFYKTIKAGTKLENE